jgi:hypothetical protein
MAWHVLRIQMEEWPPVWKAAVNILNKQSQTGDNAGQPAWGWGKVLIISHCKSRPCYEMVKIALGLLD